jgi:hypothetical protein
MARFLKRNSPGKSLLALMPPTWAAARKTYSGRTLEKKNVDRLGVAKVQLAGALADEVAISLPFQTPPDGASGQTVVAGDVDL